MMKRLNMNSENLNSSLNSALTFKIEPLSLGNDTLLVCLVINDKVVCVFIYLFLH